MRRRVCEARGPTHLHFLSFFFNDAATAEIYTLSLHDALPISCFGVASELLANKGLSDQTYAAAEKTVGLESRSEEHTSELQSLTNLVCRLLLEKKNDEGEVLLRAARLAVGSYQQLAAAIVEHS